MSFPGQQRKAGVPDRNPSRHGASPDQGRGEPDAARWGVAILWGAAIAVGLALTFGGQRRNAVRPEGAPLGTGDLAPVGALAAGSAGGPSRPGPAVRGGGPLKLTLGYTYRRLLSLEDAAPGGGAFAGDFEISDLNDAGQAPIVSEAEGGEALFLVAPEGVKRLAAPGEPTPLGGSRYGSPVWTPQAINRVGQVAWSSQVESGETWTFRYDAQRGRTEVVARPGMAAPGGGTFQRAGRQRPEINSAGDVAFVAHVAARQGDDPVSGVFLLSSEGMRLVAREGTPIRSGESITAAEGPSINDAGVVVFHATVSGSDRLGVYRWQKGSLTAVASPGDVITTGARLQQAFYPQVDARGRVAFVGRTKRGDGLYRWDGTAITPMIEPGAGLADAGRLGSLDFNRRHPFHLNAGGAVAFSGDAEGRPGVYLWERGKIRVVALAGMTLPGVGPAAEVGTLGRSGMPSYEPPVRAEPAAASAIDGDGDAPSGGSPLSAASTHGQPGGPYGIPPGAPYGYPMGGSFGLALSDDGKVLFGARVNGRECLVLATPKAAAARK